MHITYCSILGKRAREMMCIYKKRNRPWVVPSRSSATQESTELPKQTDCPTFKVDLAHMKVISTLADLLKEHVEPKGTLSMQEKPSVGVIAN